MTAYAELQVTTNFSFLRGASHPAELVLRARELGHGAIAVADRNTLAGVVRAHAAAKELDFRLVIGCRLDLTDASSLLCFPTDRAAYGRLCRLLTRGKRRAEKGACHLAYADVVEHGAGQVMVALPPERPDAGFAEFLKRVAADFAGRAYVLAATTPSASIASPRWRRAPACRSSPPTTSTTTRRRGAGCRTSSPASAKAAPSPRPGSASRPMPSAT